MRPVTSRLALALALGAVAVVTLSASVASSAEPAARRPSFELRLGEILGFTGALSSFAPSLDSSLKMAIDDVNAAIRQQGHAGRMSVRLVAAEDDQLQVRTAVEAAQKLVNIDKIDVLVGTLSSPTSIAVAQSVTIPTRTVQIIPLASATSITSLPDNGYVWRVAPSGAFEANVLVKAVAARFGRRATINVGAVNSDCCVGTKDVFMRAWRANGGRIGQSVSWNAESPTFDTEAQRLVRGSPDGWVIIDIAAGFERLAPSLVRAGGWSAAKTFVVASMRNAVLLKKIGVQATDGLRGVSLTGRVGSFRTEFDERFKRFAPERRVTGFEGAMYDAVALSFLAAVKAGSSDPARIRANLRSVSGPPGARYTYRQLGAAIRDLLAGREIDYEGVHGPIDWDVTGDPSSGFAEVWGFKDGRISTISVFALRGRQG